jgi:hypothetical protein
MCDAPAILVEARRNGLRLWRDGTRIAVAPARLCRPDLLAALRAHKQRVLDLLEAEVARLPPDCARWLYVARQVLAGEFDGAANSTVQSLTIELRDIRHPLCQQALIRLRRTHESGGSAKP